MIWVQVTASSQGPGPTDPGHLERSPRTRPSTRRPRSLLLITPWICRTTGIATERRTAKMPIAAIALRTVNRTWGELMARASKDVVEGAIIVHRLRYLGAGGSSV